jgi:hypothetical protein
MTTCSTGLTREQMADEALQKQRVSEKHSNLRSQMVVLKAIRRNGAYWPGDN